MAVVWDLKTCLRARILWGIISNSSENISSQSAPSEPGCFNLQLPQLPGALPRGRSRSFRRPRADEVKRPTAVGSDPSWRAQAVCTKNNKPTVCTFDVESGPKVHQKAVFVQREQDLHSKENLRMSAPRSVFPILCCVPGGPGRPRNSGSYPRKSPEARSSSAPLPRNPTLKRTPTWNIYIARPVA